MYTVTFLKNELEWCWVKKEIFELPEDRTNIYKRNMVSRYLIRRHDEMFEHLCYALFIKRYQLKKKPIENDSQPGKLIDILLETNYPISNSYLEVLVLSSGEKLHYRKVELVLRDHVPIYLRIQRAMLIICFLCFIHFVVNVN